MDCFFCKKDAGRTSKDVKAILCGDCVQILTGPPQIAPPQVKVSSEERKARKAARIAKKAAKLESLKTAKRGRGRGWHLKKLFEMDGQFYSMGKEITAVEAAKIRKALAAEPVVTIPKRRGRPPKAR